MEADIIITDEQWEETFKIGHKVNSSRHGGNLIEVENEIFEHSNSNTSELKLEGLTKDLKFLDEYSKVD